MRKLTSHPRTMRMTKTSSTIFMTSWLTTWSWQISSKKTWCHSLWSTTWA